SRTRILMADGAGSINVGRATAFPNRTFWQARLVGARAIRIAWIAVMIAWGVMLPLRADEANPPEVAREFRGLWVATVANIDWPSKPGLPAETQKAELIALFDRAQELNFNAIILQVRPAADALYRSPL